MLKWPALIIVFLAFMAAQAAFFSALPTPLNGIDLCLIAVIGLVASFRPSHAYAAAAAGGLARDLVTSAPVGSNVFVAVAVAALLVLLFERVVTNLSVISFAALNAAGYLAYGLLAAILGFFQGAAGGGSFLSAWTANRALSWAAALPLQVIAGVALLLASRLIHRYLRTRFLYSEHA